MLKRKRLIWLAAMLLIICLLPLYSLGEAQASDAIIRIDGVRVAFFSENGEYLPPVEQDGIIYVPAVSLGESLGIQTVADSDTLTVTVNGIRTAFFGEDGSYIPAINVRGTVFVPLEAFARSVGITLDKEGNAFTISRGAASETGMKATAETVPEFWWIELDKDNFTTYFSYTFSESGMTSWEVEVGPATFIRWAEYLTLHCTARTNYEYKNVSFSISVSPSRTGKNHNAETTSFGSIVMPQSGELSDTKQYSTLQLSMIAPDSSLAMFAGAFVTYASGEIRIPYTEAQGIYEEGIQAMREMKLEKAIACFTRLGEFRDCRDQLAECQIQIKPVRYQEAVRLLENKEYQKAMELFSLIKEYEDSAERIKACLDGLAEEKKAATYKEAVGLQEERKYQEAINLFSQIEDYEDSADRIRACRRAEKITDTGYSAVGGTFKFERAPVRDMNGKWGFVDTTGYPVIPCQYDKCSEFINGYSVVTVKEGENEKKGVIDREGNVIIPVGQFENVGTFSEEGLCCIKQDGKYGYADIFGDIMIPPVYDDASFFSEGFASVKINGKWGTIDSSGEIVISPGFDHSVSFFEGIAVAKKGERYIYIDTQGNQISDADYARAKRFSEGLSTCLDSMEKDENGTFLFRVINAEGETVYTKRIQDIGTYQEGLAYFINNNAIGFLDREGNEVIKPEYSNLHMNFNGIYEGYAAAKKDGKWGIIDKNGNTVIPFEYENMYPYNDGYCTAWKDGKLYIINESGQNVFD